MTHPRTQLRALFVARLIDATDAEERVFSGRLIPIEEPQLPAIVIHTRDQELITARSVSGWDGYEQRRCIVSAVCVAQSFDDIDEVLDTMAAQVEARLQNWTIPGFESAEIEPHTTDSDDPDFEGSLTTGATTLRFPVTYYTPFRVGPNPYSAGDDDSLEHSGSYPGGQITPGGQTGEACPVGNATLYGNQEQL